MGRLPQSPFEVRLAATLFLLLMGIADFFGAWQVRRFAAFSPAGVAETVRPEMHHEMTMACCMESAAEEKPIDLGMLNTPRHQVNRDLLVQDTHVHVPAYAMTAAFLSLIVFGLALSRKARIAVISLAFAAPFADFAGLWGAHLFPEQGTLYATLAVGGGFAMGVAYLIVFVLTLKQSWFSGTNKEISHE